MFQRINYDYKQLSVEYFIILFLVLRIPWETQ